MTTDYKIENNALIITLNPKMYSLKNIYATTYVYLDDFYVLLDGNLNDEVIVKIKPKKDVNLDQTAQRFFNDLISITNYFNQFEQNKDVINAVLQRALFSASPKLVEDAEEQEINKLLEEVEKDVSQN